MKGWAVELIRRAYNQKGLLLDSYTYGDRVIDDTNTKILLLILITNNYF